MLGQRTFVLHPSPFHLLNKLVMARIQFGWLQEAAVNIALHTYTFAHRPDEHVHLYMLPEEVLVAH